MSNRYLTIKEVAAILGVGRSQAYALVKTMPRARFGAAWRVGSVDLEAWIAARTVQPAPKPAPPPLDARIAAKAAKYHQRRDAVRAAREAVLGKRSEAPAIRVRQPRT